MDFAEGVRHKRTVAFHFSVFDLLGQGFDFIFSIGYFPLQLIELAPRLIENMNLLLIFLAQLILQLLVHFVHLQTLLVSLL